MSPKAASFALLAAIGILALLVYANSLANGFVWDDPIILTRQLVVFRSFGDVLLPPRGIPQFSPDYYRPLTVASYLLDRLIGGGSPFMFHFSVVLFHAATAALVYLFGITLFGRDRCGIATAAAGAALFAVHPVHTESVAWAAGRSDVLATCFLLAALVVHSGGPGSLRRSLLTGACTVLALGAKEISVAVFPLLVIQDTVSGRLMDLPVTGWLRRYGGVLTAGAIYVALRRAAIGEFIGSAPGEALEGGALGGVIGAAGGYLAKLVWPVGLSAYIDHVPSGPWVIVSAVTLVFVSAIAIAWWRRRKRVPATLVMWIGLTLLPSLPIVWKIPEAPMAERYLYLPSVGFCLLVGYGLSPAWRRDRRTRAFVAAGLVIVLTLAAAGTVRRNRVWRDDVSLWEDTARKSLVSGMPLRSLATAYQQRGRVDEARQYFERALGRRNSPVGLQAIYSNLGTLAMQAQDFATAERNYRQALDMNPNAPDMLFNLGLAILQGQGATPAAAENAMGFFLRAQSLSPHDGDIQAALGQTYAIRGDRPRAIQHLRRAVELSVSPASRERVKNFLEELERAELGGH